MKYISICSGIEAATTAWHGLGWTPLAFSEIEPFPSAVLAERWPQVPNLGDMSRYREWPEEILVECDLLVGGSPCQAFSVAGLRRSLDDERGNLSLIYVQLFHHINAVRRKHERSPAIALWENVPGVLSTKDNAFGCFISGLLGVDDTIETQDGKWPKAGFLGSETVRVGYRVLDAQYFGVAQRRRRVFLVAAPCELVANLGKRACPSEILSLRESVLGNPPTRGEAGQATAGTITARTGRNGGSANDDVDGGRVFAFHPTQDPISSADGTTHAMGCGSKGGCCTQAVAVPYVKATNQHNKEEASRFEEAQVAACLNGWDERHDPPKHVVAFAQNTRDEVRQVNGDGQISGALSAEPGMKQTTYVAFKESQSGCRTGDVHATTDANKGSRRQEGVFAPAMQVRRLTPTECCRLQGFPDDHCDITFRKKPAADGPKYRALGNSMAVPCMLWLGWRIHKATV